MRPLRGLQETRVATREESGVLGFPSPTEPQGWAEGGVQGARATLEPVARRRFGTERVNPVRAHSPPSTKLGLPRRPATHPEKARRHPSTQI